MHLFINPHISVQGDLNPRALRILTWIFVAFISDLQCCDCSVNICCSGLERKKKDRGEEMREKPSDVRDNHWVFPRKGESCTSISPVSHKKREWLWWDENRPRFLKSVMKRGIVSEKAPFSLNITVLMFPFLNNNPHSYFL